MGPFNNQEDLDEVADSILRIAQIGIIMQEDPQRTFSQYNTGRLITRIALDLLGDLYLINGNTFQEKIIGFAQANLINSELVNIRKNSLSSQIPLLFNNDFEITFAFILWIMFTLLIITLFLFFIAFIWTIITNSFNKDINIFWPRIITIIMILSGVPILFFIGQNESRSSWSLIFTTFILILGCGLLIYRISKKGKIKKLAFSFPIYLMFLGIMTMLFYFKGISNYFSAFIAVIIIIPGSLILGSLYSIERSNERWSDFFSTFSRITAETIAIITIIIIISWAVVGRDLNNFMEMDNYDIMSEIKGPGAKVPFTIIRNYGPHYFRNDGSYSDVRLKRIKRIEEMYGESFK